MMEIGEFALNSVPGAVVVGILLMLMDGWYLKHSTNDSKTLNNLVRGTIFAVMSFIGSLYMSIFFAGRASEKNSEIIFSLSLGSLLTAVGILAFVRLLYFAKKQIKNALFSKEKAQKMYLKGNALMGFGMANYMFGVLFLILFGLGTFITSLTDMIPQGIIGGTVALILFVGWVFALPMYLIGKTPGWLLEISERF